MIPEGLDGWKRQVPGSVLADYASVTKRATVLSARSGCYFACRRQHPVARLVTTPGLM